MAKRRGVRKSSVRSTRNRTEAKKNIPLGVKILSILCYIDAALALLFGVFLFVVGLAAPALISSIKDQIISQGQLTAQQVELIASLSAPLLVIISFLIIAFAILDYYIARGLWRGRNWARIVVLVFMVLGFISSLFSLLTGNFGRIISLVIYGLVGWYLGFDKNVKRYFLK